MSQNEEEDIVDLSPTSSLRTLKSEPISSNIIDFSKQSSAVSVNKMRSANKSSLHHAAAAVGTPSFQPIADMSQLTNHFAANADGVNYGDQFSVAASAVKDSRIFNSITGTMEGAPSNVDMNALQSLVAPFTFNNHTRSFTTASGSRSSRVETEI